MSRYLSLVVMLACTPSSTTSSEGRTLPPTDAPVAASAPAIAVPGARPEKLRVRITGVIAPSGAQSGARPGARAAAPAGQPDAPLEICPGERLQVCSGVALAGTVAPGLVSTPGNVVVARITGLYDGARLELEGPSERIAPAPEPDHRNPCPQYQSPLRGGASPSNELRELAARIEKEHPERHAGSWWDRERKTLTVKLTGDASELAERFQAPSKSERLCVAGSAKHSTRELLAALEHVSAQLPRQNTWFLGGGPDVFSNELVVRIENVDAGVLSMVRQAAGEGARVESFIELTEGSLADLPLPPPKGDIPLVTNPSRWSYGGMRALGFFTIRFDAAAGCVYFEDVKSERVLPIWPHGYAAYVEPFRVVDFDDHVVSNGERQTFGGGNVPLPDFDPRPPSCGAQAAWVGHPSVRAARAPDVPPRKGR